MQGISYSIVRRIARTQSGEIFECERRDCVANVTMRVAVKCVPLPAPAVHRFDVSVPSLASQPVSAPASLSKRHLPGDPIQEQRVVDLLTASGGHAHVVQCYKSVRDRDTLFLVMEHCSAGDLLAHIHSLPSCMVGEAAALAFTRQILLGVQFLHSLGIAHRDLSLENVLLQDGVCKIADFGLSTDADRASSDVVGKAYYMAPEVAARESYDAKRADVWSLGMMLFIMLTGSPLVTTTSPDDKSLLALATHGVEAILVAWELRALVSTEVVSLLSKMLLLDPTQRISVDEILTLPLMASSRRRAS